MHIKNLSLSVVEVISRLNAVLILSPSIKKIIAS